MILRVEKGAGLEYFDEELARYEEMSKEAKARVIRIAKRSKEVAEQEYNKVVTKSKMTMTTLQKQAEEF